MIPPEVYVFGPYWAARTAEQQRREREAAGATAEPASRAPRAPWWATFRALLPSRG